MATPVCNMGDIPDSPQQQESDFVPCHCKSTCATLKCNCKKNGKFCLPSCLCGTVKKPCKNKVPVPSDEESNSLAPLASTSDNISRRIHQTTNVAVPINPQPEIEQYLSTLSEHQVRQICIRLLAHGGGVDLAQCLLDPEPSMRPVTETPSWCNCGYCRPMPTDIEQVCCRRRTCITRYGSFRNVVLDREVLTVGIHQRCDLRADPIDYSNNSYRKAAYRNYILWNNGHLGYHNRRVVPSCVTWSIRDHYPDARGQYMGFKAY